MDPQTTEAVPFWLANVDPKDWPKECPDFLANTSERDQRILATPDSQYHRLTWPEVQDIIRTNRIDLFQRVPSDLRKYLQYTAKIKADWVSIMDFVLSQRLQWRDLTPSGPPFTIAGMGLITTDGRGSLLQNLVLICASR